MVESVSATGAAGEVGAAGRGGAMPPGGPPPAPLLLASPCPYAAAYSRVAHSYAGIPEVHPRQTRPG